ncbi:hypothetical protein GCM10027022_18620 [Alpinimonas psychrophila]|uniref:Bacterial Ig-like domain-containing protein n=1 Tax=Alpinimonas psychrophila TaxID=748908 RepID=A0A7W3JUX4_9MICO|nr:Ig-like domain-containing protein [Alpinimonas psychrophila]MBA8829567.1 hypothetical protein [Alpinimonas psychrophila]
MSRRNAPVARRSTFKLGLVGLVGLLTFALAASALPASAAVTSTIPVYQDDLSSTNVSSGRTSWDSSNSVKFNELPAAGTKWALDIENKPAGSALIGVSGLTLSVTNNNSTPTKVRYQYYVGTGGYPAVDARFPTLIDVFAAPLGWDQALVSGEERFGVGLQIQLEKEITPGAYARVTVTNTAVPGTGPRDFRTGNWFANTNIHADGYLDGIVVNERYFTVGVARDILLTNFGDFKVVSFGPNLGRDLAYDYRVQDFTILDQTFHFTVPSVSTSSTVSVSPSGSAIAGAKVTITGTVSPSDAIGTIEIFDNGTSPLGAGAAAGGVFTVVTSTLSVGSHSFTATFTPTNPVNYQASTSPAVTFSVNKAEVPAPPPTPSGSIQIVEPIAPQIPVVTEQTPPPPPVTAQIVLTKIGSSTAQLLERYQTANNGNAPPPAAEVLTIAAGELEARTGAILSTTHFVASMPWTGNSDDQWVDVWAYSTPTYIGTFPVINGVLKITGADLSALTAGDHHLVLVGQSSGASEVMGFAIADPASVPGDNVTVTPEATNPNVTAESPDLGWLLWAAIAGVAIAAITTIGTVIRRRRD